MNITEYVRGKNAGFSEAPFNDVDALVLCQLFYSKIEAVLEGEQRSFDLPGYSLRDFYKAEYFPLMFGDGITDRENRELFAAACASPRYRDLEVRHVEVDTDSDREKQFAAMAFAIDGETDFVAFRGTDGSMLGWKEDFNMAFMDEVPSQRSAVEYLNRYYGGQAEESGRSGSRVRRLYTGGHSKGGNLAIYGALNADKTVRSRLITVYSLEGPGFRDEVNDRLNIAAEGYGVDIVRIVPQSSLIGMIMSSQEPARVVEAKAIGVAQHSSYTWQIDGDDFKYTTLSLGGGYNGRVLHEWLEKVNDEEREVFVDRLFGLLFDNDIRSVRDIRKVDTAKIKEVVSSFNGLDEESRHVMQDVIYALIVSAVRGFWSWK